ncbi:HEAT repeat domain-containing protein [Pseudomonas quasicaspiana]|uniref:HEAT repeat domain-containing protein n=1 Tax=Pseudomonas quasicaspiana TaxID=2829821 RepID=UPI001E4FF76E|nr:HEAT repeat domain-containing protein [Pseudomonas quasicaspiana]
MDIGTLMPVRGFFSKTSARRRIALIAGLILIALIGVVYLTRQWSTPPAPPVLSQTYGEALELAHNGKPGAARVLYQHLARNDLSDIRRASLLAELANYPSPQALKLLDAALQNDSVLIRQAAIEVTTKMLPDGKRSILLGPLLEDPEAAVRLAATMALLDLSPDELGLYFAALQHSVDLCTANLKTQPATGTNQLQLARLLAHSGEKANALSVLKAAMDSEPKNLDVAIAYLDQLDQQGQAERARQLLAQLLAQHPHSSRLQHALGMWLLVHDQTEYALLALAKAVELEPDNTDYRYDLAVALHDLEQVEAAQKQLAEILQRQPANRKARVLLIRYWKETGQLQNVQVLQAGLEQQNPDDPALQQGL